MGTVTRRGAGISAALLAGALAFAPGAMAAGIDGSPVSIDGAPDATGQDQAPKLYRFAGEDRISTALDAAKRTDLPWSDTAIIANSAVFADALAAAPLADLMDAPVLMNKPGETRIDQRNLRYLDENGFTEVVLIGGTQIFSADVVKDLETGDASNGGLNYYLTDPNKKDVAANRTYVNVNVNRIEGANRYDTAIEIADVVYNEFYATGNINIFLASGLDFPDALSAGAAAAAHDGVVLLTKGAEGLDQNTWNALSGNGSWYWGPKQHASIIAVGGPAKAAAEAGWMGNAPEVNFSSVGDNRYETAALVAKKYLADAENYVVASGENFPDGVVGGAYAANVDGALLLTKHNAVPNVTLNVLKDQAARSADPKNNYSFDNIFVFGGEGSVGKKVSSVLSEEIVWKY